MLARLARRFAKVAVVSGRPVAYLVANLAGAGRTELVGLYGLESQLAELPEAQVSSKAAPFRQSVESVADEAERQAAQDPRRFAGLGVERKGLTVTLHFRRAPSLAEWAESFAASQAEATGLVAHPGKMSVELRPPVDTDKGTVVASFAEGLAAVCYLGDDVGDLPAFETLATLRSRGVATLAVAVRSGIGDETPPAVVAAADVVVDGPVGALGVLRALAGDPPG